MKPTLSSEIVFRLESFNFIEILLVIVFQFPTALEIQSVHSGPVYCFTNPCTIYPHFYKSLFRLEGGPPADLWFACIGLPPGSYNTYARASCLLACMYEEDGPIA